MKKISLFYVLLNIVSSITFFGCAPRDNALRKLAEEGKIHKDAPLVNTVSITIDAPVSKVWGIVTNIPEWASWNSTIASTLSNGVTYLGDNFAWKWGKKVYSAVLFFEPEKKLVWFSKSMAYISIMKWEFEKISPTQTKVTLSESRDEFFMNFASSKNHKKMLSYWLSSLKLKAETIQF